MVSNNSMGSYRTITHGDRHEMTVPGEGLLQLADWLSDGLCVFDDQGCITYANQTFLRLLHAKQGDLISKSIIEFVFESDRVVAQKLFEDSDTHSGCEQTQIRLRTMHGTVISCYVCPVRLRQHEGKFHGLAAVFRPIVTPKEATEAQALATAIVDATDDAIVTKSLDGIIRSWNRGAENLFGYTAKEAIGKSILMLLPDDRKDEEAEILSIVRSGKVVDHFETIRRRKDGSLIDVSLTISPLFDETGAIIGASKVARDITEQRRKAELRSHLASIVESSDDAIVSKTREGIIESWNRGAERIFGYTAEEAIGKPILLIVPQDRKYEEADILARICRGERIEHFETVRQRKDGSYVDVSVTISPILTAHGQVVGASKVARDISEQKRSNERMQLSLEKLVKERTLQLERANKELEGFTYSVSHDLRGPLRSIVSSCMILREDFGPQLPAEAQEELQKQAKAAKRMADLIDDLLKLSRLGRQELTKSNLDLTGIAEEISSDIKSAGSHCEISIAKGMRAYGDPPTIKLLLSNLIENACKFSNQVGPVEIGQEDSTFFVKDRGIGFDQQYAEKLFLPFERLVLDRDYPGTGIGLANVKRIVERHGGKVWAESEGLGKGAIFHFSLPAA